MPDSKETIQKRLDIRPPTEQYTGESGVVPDSKETIQKRLDIRQPTDGFQVRSVTCGTTSSLYLCLLAGGRPLVPNMEVWTYGNSLCAVADGQRLRQLLEAMCRFLNTDGHWSALQGAYDDVTAFCERGRLQFCFPGYELVGTFVNSDNVHEHLFTQPQGQYAIRWVEGQFFDVLSLQQLQEELEEAKVLDDLCGEPGADDRLELPGGDGPAPAEDATGQPQ